MSPAVVLSMLAGLGGRVDRVVVVGCQPAELGDGIGLSEPVAAAVDEAVRATKELLAEICEAKRERTP
jgi:hydrogenase maturation protease